MASQCPPIRRLSSRSVLGWRVDGVAPDDGNDPEAGQTGRPLVARLLTMGARARINSGVSSYHLMIRPLRREGYRKAPACEQAGRRAATLAHPSPWPLVGVTTAREAAYPINYSSRRR